MSRVEHNLRNILPKVEEHWNALLQTLEGHSGTAKVVAFSPDGKQLASASADAGLGAGLRTIQVDAVLLTLSLSRDWTAPKS